MEPKFKVGDKVALASHPRYPCYVITSDRGNDNYECRTLSGSYEGFIDRSILDQWVVAHDGNYIIDRVLAKYLYEV